MQTGVIICRHGDKDPTEMYLKTALTNNPSAWSCAIVNDDGEIEINKDEKPDLEIVQDTLKVWPEKDMVLSFVSADSGLNLDDVPPWILLGDSDKPVLIGFAEGNWPGHVKKESSHPAEFFFVHEYLIPKLQSLYEMVDSDIDKLMTNLAKPVFKKDMLQGAVSRGTVTLLACNGERLTYNLGDNAEEYEWGWVSNNYAYAKNPEADKPEASSGKRSFPKRSTVREPASGVSNSAATANSSAASSSAKAPAKGGAAAQNYTVRMERPPSHLSRRETIDWYKVRVGYRPRKWEDRIEVQVIVDAQGKTLTMTQIKDLGLKAAGLPNRSLPERDENKDTEPAHITSPPSPNGPAVTDEVLPVMSPETRKWINEFRGSDKVKKIIAENGTAISDPKHVQELEAKFASFAAQLGCKDMSEFKPWSYSMFLEVARAKPEGMAIMAWNLMNFYRKHSAKADVKTEQELSAAELKPEPGKRSFPKRATG